MSRSRADVERFVDGLASARNDGLFNPWGECCAYDLRPDAPSERRGRLVDHLSCPDCRLILVGEAPGYAGCRISGVPFTSEFLLEQGAIPRMASGQGRRLTSHPRPLREPSATIVWSTLFQLGIAEQTVLWNACPWHPMGAKPLSNRTPTEKELVIGLMHLESLLNLFPAALVVAVGKKAASSLELLGVKGAASVRHPAYGGKNDFVAGLRAATGGG